MNEAQTCEAPRSPGIEPRWTSSAKSGVGTALLACTRDLGLIVTGEHGFFSEEKRHAEHQIKSLASGIPAYDLVNTHAGHYRITKRIVSDPYRDVVLQRLTFEALSQTGGRYRVYALLAPHLVNAGASNTAWLGGWLETMAADGDAGAENILGVRAWASIAEALLATKRA